jgi:hypothetical protein
MSRSDILARLSMVTSETVEPTPSPKLVAEARQPEAETRVRTSIYLPAHTHARLREMAFRRNVHLNAVMMEAIDAYLTSSGHPDDVTTS